MRNDPFMYSVKVWLLTMVLSPTLVTICKDGNSFSLELLGVVLIYGMLLSIPSLILFTAISFLLYRLVNDVLIRKIILAVIGVTFVFLSFSLLGLGFSKEILPYATIYSVILVTGVFIVGLDQKSTSENPSKQ